MSHGNGNSNNTGMFVRIAPGTWSGDIADVEAGGAAANFGSAANPDSLSPSWGSADTLWIATCGCDDDDGGLSGYPADYDDNQTLAMNTDRIRPGRSSAGWRSPRVS